MALLHWFSETKESKTRKRGTSATQRRCKAECFSHFVVEIGLFVRRFDFRRGRLLYPRGGDFGEEVRRGFVESGPAGEKVELSFKLKTPWSDGTTHLLRQSSETLSCARTPLLVKRPSARVRFRILKNFNSEKRLVQSQRTSAFFRRKNTLLKTVFNLRNPI